MSDIKLREVERAYRSEPTLEIGRRLIKLLLRHNQPPEHCNLGEFRSEGKGRAIMRIWGLNIYFSGNDPVAYHVQKRDKNYYILRRDERHTNLVSRHINKFLPEKLRPSRSHYPEGVVETTQYDINWAIAERYHCRLANLLAYYSKYAAHNLDNAALVGIICDTYCQSSEPPHGIPLHAEQGIDRGGYCAYSGNTWQVDLGTYIVLISYGTPSAAINKQTRQCFYTSDRSQTTSCHIGAFFRSHNLEHTRWQKDCIEVSSFIIKAIFS